MFPHSEKCVEIPAVAGTGITAVDSKQVSGNRIAQSGVKWYEGHERKYHTVVQAFQET